MSTRRRRPRHYMQDSGPKYSGCVDLLVLLDLFGIEGYNRESYNTLKLYILRISGEKIKERTVL